MQGLARYAMTGRFRALLIAIACSGSLFFAWIGAAVVGLVTLRRGPQEGLWLLLWASLPALVLIQLTGDSSTLALLVGTAVLALVLRSSVSLALTAVAASVVAIATGMLLLLFGQELLDALAAVFDQFFASLEQQARDAGAEPVGLARPSPVQLAGMMGTANAALSFLCLALARYWQAALYNPGGFGEEFRSLRLPRAWVIACALAALGLMTSGLEFRSWGAALLLPLTVAGFALLHARARYRGQGSFWIGAIYLGWVVFDAAKLALVGLVFVDALMDFRQRWRPQDAGRTTVREDREQSEGEPEESREESREEGREENRDRDEH